MLILVKVLFVILLCFCNFLICKLFLLLNMSYIVFYIIFISALF